MSDFDPANPFVAEPGRFALGALSRARASTVVPDLQAVIGLAIRLSSQDFMVVEGKRTDVQCYINWGKGRTVGQCRAIGMPTPELYAQPKLKKVTWLRNPLSSNHRSGRAVDLVPFPVDWNTRSKFVSIAGAMKAAAAQLGVNMVWGGDWKSSPDLPHFEVT